MNLYQLLGVSNTATTQDIRDAYRKQSKKHHPDANKTDPEAPEAFRRIREAHDVLIDVERRARYDATGRISVTHVTQEAIERFLGEIVRTVARAHDDPTRTNVREKIVMSLMSTRRGAESNLMEATRKVERATELLNRFMRKKGQGRDFIKVILSEELTEARKGQDLAEDAIELSDKCIEFFMDYDYRIGPEPEGPMSSGPTLSIGRSRRQAWEDVTTSR